MTDKVEDKKVDEKVEDKKIEEKVEEPQYTEVEVEAMDQGWLPKDQWEESGRDPAEWRDAREFKARGELFKTIHQTKRELKQTQAALTALQKHHTYVFDQAHRKALAELRKERREALRAEDVDKVEQIETQIEETETEFQTAKTQMQQEQVSVQTAGTHPEFEAWVDRNQWYSNDEELRDRADAIGIVYTKKHPGVVPQEVLKYVEKEVRKQFPEKFGGKKTAPNAVVSVDRTTSSRKKSEPAVELNEFQDKIARDLERNGTMTRTQYIAELKKLGELQ